jgi:dipeptidyl aminopeptidase/acylaminoacyl peptidase
MNFSFMTRINRLLLLVILTLGGVAAEVANFTLPQAMDFPFLSDLVTDRAGNRMAWVRIVGGERNIWVADGPGATPRQVTQFKGDEGVEITQLTFSPDGKSLVFVRGGDHDGNWAAEGDLTPNAMSSPETLKVEIWRADPSGKLPAAKVTEGDAPALSARGQLVYLKDRQTWTVGLDGEAAKRLFFDRGKNDELSFSPDGTRLAFRSNRGDHSFIGVFTNEKTPLLWLAPSTGRDASPRWSPDGSRIAFTRRPGDGGPPEPLLEETIQPWAIWTADATTGKGTKVWASPRTLRGSFPDVAGGANLFWAAGDRLAFLSAQSNWQSLYSVSVAGGEATLLTPGDFMVEHVALSPDRTTMIYSANTGTAPDDDARRHIFRVSVAGGASLVALTSGVGLEWSPVGLASGAGFISAGAKTPLAVGVVSASGARSTLPGQPLPADFAGAQFVVPKQVNWTAPDGLLIHGQLFETPGGAKKPGVIFVHGGPPRQMMLGFSYMAYYANAYAMNQYLAAHGFTVLSINFRRGIGYGWDFQHPPKGGWAGSSEYQDVLSGAKYLAGLPGVDGSRLGIWGGSYGGLLTALALARDSDTFKAGVDIHGVHDWSERWAKDYLGPKNWRWEQGDKAKFSETAFRSSPVADVATWTSPVLLIHGDDDRNVRFGETINLARRLDAQGVEFEELVIPDEIHDFLRYANWLRVYEASADFLTRKLGVTP